MDRRERNKKRSRDSTPKKQRRKADSIKEYCRDIPDDLYDRVNLSDVKKTSGVTLETCNSFHLGIKTLKLRGTRSQILEALRLIGEVTGLKRNDLEKAHIEWADWVQKAFPELERRSYFLPPVYIRRVPLAKRKFAGQDVLMLRTEDPQNPSEGQLDVNSLPTV